MYKVIKEFPAYLIYNDGRVYSTKTNQFMSIGEDDRGYKQVSFYQNGKGHTKKIHRLVAEAFIPNPNNLPQVNHIDENKSNNHYTNLEWCTKDYNIHYGTRTERAALTNRTANQGQRKVGAYKNNELVKEFISISEGARFTGDIKHRPNIVACLNGRQKTSYGYEWKYID